MERSDDHYLRKLELHSGARSFHSGRGKLALGSSLSGDEEQTPGAVKFEHCEPVAPLASSSDSVQRIPVEEAAVLQEGH